MSIPLSQLETWSHQGSITQSAQTYESVRRCLEAPSTAFAHRSKTIFLQGSYGNHTNIYAESDVDVVILCHDTFFYDADSLPDPDKAATVSSITPASYLYDQYKAEVFNALVTTFGYGVVSGNRSIKIPGNVARRDADVLVAFDFRRYYSRSGYHAGVCFFDPMGRRIENYPQTHSENLTSKHQRTRYRFKPTVRMMKNLRNKAIERGLLNTGEAPSYFIEGLLYNVPDNIFMTDLDSCFASVWNWVNDCKKDELLCANERFYLLNEFSLVTWRRPLLDKFMKATSELWNSW